MMYSFHQGALSGIVTLDEEESHHLVAVRRARAGERVTLVDGRGNSALAEVETPHAKRATLRVLELRTMPRPGAPLWLAQALPLGRTMETIVQKAAELGTARILPLAAERSEMRLDAERTEKKTAKWRAGAIEAVKQCGNPFLPEIDEPMSVAALLALPLPGARMVCSLEEGTRPILDAVRTLDCSAGLVIAIGPEGDFSPAEYARLREAGFVPVTLGPLVLRTETAAIASLAIAGAALRTQACCTASSRGRGV
jgi:16S rRNA (uracil1498-N3)-methyltransferase